MKKSITIWALNGGTTGEIKVVEAAKQVKEAGFDAIEVSFWEKGDISFESDCFSLQKLRKELQENNLTISSMSTLLLNQVSLISDNKSERIKAFDVCRRMIETASELGVNTVSVSPGKILEEVSYRDCFNRSIEQIRKLVEIAEKKKVVLCVENVWQGLLLSPMEFRLYCDKVDSPNMAACIDIGNASISTYAQHWVTELGPQIGKVHITDLKKRRNTIYEFVDPGKGNTDWNMVMRSLCKTEYDGYLTIEAFQKNGLENKERLESLNRCLEEIMEINRNV